MRFATLHQAYKPHDGTVRVGKRGSGTEMTLVQSGNKMIDPRNLSREPTLVGLALPPQRLETDLVTASFLSCRAGILYHPVDARSDDCSVVVELSEATIQLSEVRNTGREGRLERPDTIIAAISRACDAQRG